jgi:phage terminase small subunit
MTNDSTNEPIDNEPEGTLTAKQQCFIAEYLVDLNATQAAIRAGYSEKTAKEIGSQNLGKPAIQVAIAAAMEERQKRTEVNQDFVIGELKKIAQANMMDYMRATPGGDPYLDFSQLTKEQAAALAEVTVDDYVEGRGENARQIKRVRFKLCDKRAALVDLGRHLGMFTDNVRHSGGLTLESLLDKLDDEKK